MRTDRISAKAAAGLIVFALGTVIAQAAEVHVIGATPMRGVVTQLGKQFERDSGHTVIARFVSGPVVKREIDAGQPFDLAISITPVIDALVKEGKIVAATRADVAYAGVGVGVRAGAAKPDISTVEAFRSALLNATSVAHVAEGASGDYFKDLLARLGISEQMKPKLRPMSPDALAKAVPSGAAEMIVVTMSVIVGGAAELVGPVPAELQFYNRFAAGVGASAKEANAAKAFLAALTASKAAAAIKAAGMEPGAP
jgi:molybdate transport system substrate-binding protein